jgi:tetratricopeptide (TPR) repeat protein
MRALLTAGLLTAGLLALPWVALAAPAAAPPDARAHKEIGDQHRKAGDAEGALEAYRTALKRFGGYAEAYEAIGEVQYARKRFGEAIEAFGFAVEIDPTYALAWYNMAFAARKSDDLARARTAYQRYVKLRPADADGHYGLAETLRGQGEREAAAREYQLFIDLARSSPAQASWVERARGFLAELQAPPSAPPAPVAPGAGALAPTGAVAAVGVAAPLAPAPVPPPLSTSASLLAATPTATPTASSSTPPAESPTPPASPAANPAAPPRRPEAPPSQALIEKLGAGDRAYLAGDHRAALFLYQDAVYLEPGASTARLRLARTYAALRYPDKAEAQLRLVLDLDPANAEARKQLDELRSPRPPAAAAAPSSSRLYKFTPEAEQVDGAPPPPPSPPGPAQPSSPAQPAPEAEPSGADLYRTGVAQVSRREFALAVDSFNRALARSPELVVAYEARASARFGLGQYREASLDYQQALSANPARASALWGLAESYRLLSDPRAAEAYARYAESTAPDVTERQRELARTLAQELRGP